MNGARWRKRLRVRATGTADLAKLSLARAATQMRDDCHTTESRPHRTNIVELFQKPHRPVVGRNIAFRRYITKKPKSA